VIVGRFFVGSFRRLGHALRFAKLRQHVTAIAFDEGTLIGPRGMKDEVIESQLDVGLGHPHVLSGVGGQAGASSYGVGAHDLAVLG
jgi:hypothetical protein